MGWGLLQRPRRSRRRSRSRSRSRSQSCSRSAGGSSRRLCAVQAAWDVAALGVKGDAAGEYNKTGLAEAALRYNASWAGYTGYLLSCPTVSIQAQLQLDRRL